MNAKNELMQLDAAIAEKYNRFEHRFDDLRADHLQRLDGLNADQQEVERKRYFHEYTGLLRMRMRYVQQEVDCYRQVFVRMSR